MRRACREGRAPTVAALSPDLTTAQGPGSANIVPADLATRTAPHAIQREIGAAAEAFAGRVMRLQLVTAAVSAMGGSVLGAAVAAMLSGGVA